MEMSSTQRNIDRFFGWWYAIAAPRARSRHISSRERELVHRGKFTSLVLLIEIVESLLVLGESGSPRLLIPVFISIFILLVGVVLNRFGKVRTAGSVVVLTINLNMCLYLVEKATSGGFSPYDLAFFMVLIHPELIAISLFPASVGLLVALFNGVFTVVAILFLPKTAEALSLLSTNLYETLFSPLYVQSGVVLISLVWIVGASQQMRRANHAEEVSELSQALAFQHRT